MAHTIEKYYTVVLPRLYYGPWHARTKWLRMLGMRRRAQNASVAVVLYPEGWHRAPGIARNGHKSRYTIYIIRIRTPGTEERFKRVFQLLYIYPRPFFHH